MLWVTLLIALAAAAAIFFALYRAMLAEQAIRELNAGLLDKTAQLESANKELENFSYSMSHDLRAPLRAIDGFALRIEEDCHDKLDEDGRRYLSVIRDNSRRMGMLIDDLLRFSRLARRPVTRCQVNMDSLVREVIAESPGARSPGARSSGTDSLDAAAVGASSVRFEIGALPAAIGDRALLRQVWANLIGNAVKYSGTADHPVIQISGEQVGRESCYRVRDNGVGFDMQYADKLFGVFQRLHRADEFNGTGVGLAIVHRVVTRHGGRVWAEGSLGHGAVFSFALASGEYDG